ncbi:helix-turn-helix transcriptional regulator [Cellulomonas bogoriensis]|uniref:Transcriptional regulator n=1 Tax=Cellulomonas bogoriensis 69B4 = DSM 16987 TaxID=1386082 RepID=A0A0A0BZK7_9CELL|nr:helix-turn-helix domain-containing protein [Cellulomonas bogoriensis]KGM13813.1 transcriptional regulator [Cellulomonas bogoriensis 69B4 = DSM 16987]
MGSSATTHRALASESRVRILHLLQEQTAPVGVDAIAGHVDLHVNTVREHLDRLVECGYVRTSVEVRNRRGRPRILYSAADDSPEEVARQAVRDKVTRLLAEGYGRVVEQPGLAAQAHGKAWGTTACPGLPDGRRAPLGGEGAAAGQLQALHRHLDELGFDPTVDVERLQVHLHRCPVLDLAQVRADVVCNVHLGLAQGLLAQHPGPLRAERIDPARITPAGPLTCTLHLTQG